MIRARAVAWAVLATMLAIAAAVLFSGRAPIQTNLLALLPGTAQSDAVKRASSQLAEAVARRSIFLVGHPVPDSTKQLARQFAQSLSGADGFRDVRVEFPAPDPRALRDVYLGYRFQLLAHADQAALSRGADRSFVEDRVRRRLYDPFRPNLGTPLEQDPLGLFDNYLAALPYARLAPALDHDAGFLLTRDAERTYAVVLAEVDGSPHDAELQKRVRAALLSAETALRAADATAQVLRAGVVHHAMAARETAEAEVDRIALGSLVGIAILLLLVFRSLRPLLLGLVSVATGIGAAAVMTVGVFGEIHLITLVFGASLIGEAVDYSIQYFAARLSAGRDWDPRAGLRAVFPGVTLAVATSVLGYGALGFAPFPGLRQIALFSIVGLIAAYLTVVLLLPAFARQPATRRPERMLRAAARFWRWCDGWRNGRGRAIVIAVLVAASIPGWMRLTADDDIRLLINPVRELLTQEAAIRQLTGFTQSSQFFVIDGISRDEVLEREERLTARLRQLMQQGTLGHYQGVSDFVPSTKRQQQNYTLWQGLWSRDSGLMPVLAANGFRPPAMRHYAEDFRRHAARTLTLDAWLPTTSAAPFRHLWIGEVGSRYVTVVMPTGFSSVTLLEQTAAALPGVALVDQAGDVSRLLREYRRTGTVMLLIAALLVYVALSWRYGRRESVWTLLPTVMALGTTLAYCGYVGAPLTLFNMMGLLLVLGVGVNYVIFLHEGAERRDAALIGVLLSAATTLLSFGLLGWSATPALSQFGSTLFVGITATVLIAPLLVRGAR
jgi:predicted exporter